MKPKYKTNEQVLRQLIKELNPIENAILRERLIVICKASIQSVEEDPKAWENPIIHPQFYKQTFHKILNLIDKFDLR